MRLWIIFTPATCHVGHSEYVLLIFIMSFTLQDYQDDPKRKRGSSSNSTNSLSSLQLQKKSKEDGSVPSDIFENSVFSTPNPSAPNMAAASPHTGSHEPQADGIASNLSVGMSSPSSHESYSPDASRQSREVPLASDQKFSDLNQGARDFVITLLKTNREQFKEEVNTIIDNRLLNQKEEIAQNVYEAVSHDVDIKFN